MCLSCYKLPVNHLHIYSHVLQYFDAVGWVFWPVKPTTESENRLQLDSLSTSHHQHRLFDNGWQYVSCGQWQPPLSGAPVNKWLSTTTRERRIPPDSESGGIPHLFGTSLSPQYRQCLTGSSWQQQQQQQHLQSSPLSICCPKTITDRQTYARNDILTYKWLETVRASTWGRWVVS